MGDIQSQAREYIASKRPESREGWEILREARELSYEFPRLSGPELIRLAYWGASGVDERGETCK